MKKTGSLTTIIIITQTKDDWSVLCSPWVFVCCLCGSRTYSISWLLVQAPGLWSSVGISRWFDSFLFFFDIFLNVYDKSKIMYGWFKKILGYISIEKGLMLKVGTGGKLSFYTLSTDCCLVVVVVGVQLQMRWVLTALLVCLCKSC